MQDGSTHGGRYTASSYAVAGPGPRVKVLAIDRSASSTRLEQSRCLVGDVEAGSAQTHHEHDD